MPPPPSYMHRLKTISRVKHSALKLLVDLHTVGKDTAERKNAGKFVRVRVKLRDTRE